MLLLQAQQKQQAQALARAQAASPQPSMPSSSAAHLLPGLTSPAQSTADHSQQLQSSVSTAAPAASEPAAAQPPTHHQPARHAADENEEAAAGSRGAAAGAAHAAGGDLDDFSQGKAESEARARPQAGHQLAGSIAAAIADAWSLSLQQVGIWTHPQLHSYNALDNVWSAFLHNSGGISRTLVCLQA